MADRSIIEILQGIVHKNGAGPSDTRYDILDSAEVSALTSTIVILSELRDLSKIVTIHEENVRGE